MDFTTKKDFTKESAQQVMDLFHYDRKQLLSRKRKLTRDIIELERQKRRTGIMICAHNTILTLELKSEYDGSTKISHVVTRDNETDGIKVMPIMDVDRYLSVSRWTPDTAEKWLAEELNVTSKFFTEEENKEMSKNYRKVTMGEREFREIILADKRSALDYTNLSLKNEAFLSKIINDEDSQEEA